MNYSKLKNLSKTSKRVPKPQNSVNVHATETSKSGPKPKSE